jgi:hypothetical protein
MPVPSLHSSASPFTLSRWSAGGLHLLISAAIAGAALWLTIHVWYPPPLFTAEGGSELLLILITVDVIVGPLITLIIFRAGKPGLRGDLAIIGGVQLAALLYGMFVMFSARPVFVAFLDDQFETVRANDLDGARLAQARFAEFRSVPLGGPVTVAVDLPKNQRELMEIIAALQKTGIPVTQMPRYYVPYAQQREKARAAGRPLDAVMAGTDEFALEIRKVVAESGRKAAELKMLPIQTRRGWGAVLVDAASGDIVAMAPPVARPMAQQQPAPAKTIQ